MIQCAMLLKSMALFLCKEPIKNLGKNIVLVKKGEKRKCKQVTF